jgi:hypothetical protein
MMDDILLDDILNNMAKEGKFEISDEIVQMRKQTLSNLPERKTFIKRIDPVISIAACTVLLIGLAYSSFMLVNGGNGQSGKLLSSLVARLTTSSQVNKLQSPPGLTVTSGDKSVSAIRGSYSWTIDNRDGTPTVSKTDTAGPPDLLEGSEKLLVKPDSEMHFIFEHEPDSYEIRMWGMSIVQSAVNNSLKVPADMERIIYEVVAHWSQGTVYYAFEVTIDKTNIDGVKNKDIIPLKFYKPELEQNISIIDKKLIKEIFKEKSIKEGKVILFSKTTTAEETYVGFEIKGKFYDTGIEVVPFNESTSYLFLATETKSFNKSLIRIDGVMGANFMQSNYFSIEDGKPNIFLTVDGYAAEVDLDDDGIKEIVSSTGTAAFTKIYKYDNGSVIVSNLNDDLGASVVLLNEDTGRTFDVYYQGSNKPEHYRFNGEALVIIN